MGRFRRKERKKKSWPSDSRATKKKGRNLSVSTWIALQLSEHMREKGRETEDKSKGGKPEEEGAGKEIEDTSWVQFRGFPQEVEWPVSATIEVMQFLVDTPVFRG